MKQVAAPPQTTSTLVRPARAAEILDCSERKLWTLTNEKKIRVTRIGGSIRYALEDLQAFIDASKSPAPAA
jgi:excisionase family DNA binding protein